MQPTLRVITIKEVFNFENAVLAFKIAYAGRVTLAKRFSV